MDTVTKSLIEVIGDSGYDIMIGNKPSYSEIDNRNE